MWGWDQGTPHKPISVRVWLTARWGGSQGLGAGQSGVLSSLGLSIVQRDPICLQTSGGDVSEGPCDGSSPSHIVSAQMPTPHLLA